MTTAAQKLENILLSLDSLDRYEVYMYLEDMRDDGTMAKQLIDYDLTPELLTELGVENIIAKMDEYENSTHL